MFEKCGGYEFIQNAQFVFYFEEGMVVYWLHPVLQPPTLFRILQVHVFDTHRSAVSFFKTSNYIFKRRLPTFGETAREKNPLKVFQRQAEGLQAQQRMIGGTGG